jgi:hypothetical protein
VVRAQQWGRVKSFEKEPRHGSPLFGEQALAWKRKLGKGVTFPHCEMVLGRMSSFPLHPTGNVQVREENRPPTRHRLVVQQLRAITSWE